MVWSSARPAYLRPSKESPSVAALILGGVYVIYDVTKMNLTKIPTLQRPVEIAYTSQILVARRHYHD
uniref:Uncharacterized protein n=1 Tax=Leersia perrieri TaxID=77586 RepID=A0A0D9VZU6_9ORYZ